MASGCHCQRLYHAGATPQLLVGDLCHPPIRALSWDTKWFVVACKVFDDIPWPIQGKQVTDELSSLLCSPIFFHKRKSFVTHLTNQVEEAWFLICFGIVNKIFLFHSEDFLKYLWHSTAWLCQPAFLPGNTGRDNQPFCFLIAHVSDFVCVTLRWNRTFCHKEENMPMHDGVKVLAHVPIINFSRGGPLCDVPCFLLVQSLDVFTMVTNWLFWIYDGVFPRSPGSK